MKTVFFPLLVASALGLKIINPLYLYPGFSTYQTVAAAGLDQTLIINPGNGDANACPPNSAWLSAIQALLTSNPPVKILGYIHSSYGHRPISQLYPQIDNYYTCWGVSGIFIDEANNTAAAVSYYQQLYSYIKGKPSQFGINQVWLNPGTNVDEQYMNISDTVCIFESPFSAWNTWLPASYVKNYPNTKFCALSLNVPSPGLQATFFAQAAEFNIDYVGAVGGGANNWNNLNMFWNDELAFVASHPGQTQATTTTLAIQDNSVKAQQTITLGAQVLGGAGLTGYVIFEAVGSSPKIDSGPQRISDVNGFISWQTKLPGGNYSWKATYLGNTDYQSSVSAAQPITVLKWGTQITSFTVSTHSAYPFQQVRFDTKVIKSEVTDLPLAGPVIFVSVENSNIHYITNVTNTGSASILALIPIGTWTFGSAFAETPNFLFSYTDVPMLQQITVVKAAATVVLTITNKYVTVNQGITAVVQVKGPTGTTAIPTGSINFYRGNTLIAGGGALIGGKKTAVLKLAAGTYTGASGINARYTGSSNFNTAISPSISVTVVAKANSKTVLTIPKKSVPSTKPITFQIKVNPLLTSGIIPAGRVNFWNGNKVMAGKFVVLNAQGVGTFSGKLAKGTYKITGHYVGNINFNPSTSNLITITIT